MDNTQFMTTIKSLEEIVIYESPDGGKTVYSRNSMSGERTLVKMDPSASANAKWFLWKEILQASENSPSLANIIKEAELIYALVKKEKTQ